MPRRFEARPRQTTESNVPEMRHAATTPLELSVVIPVKDEAELIGGLIDEVVAALTPHGIGFEIVCVDDGSTDDTLQCLCARRETEPRLRVLRHAGNCGQSAALHSGVRLAASDWIATLDGDGQNDPNDIPSLWALARENDDEGAPLMLVGHRVARHDNWRRRVASRIANRVRARLLGDATPDSGCGLKLFPRALFLSLPYFDHMHRFLPALVIRQGGRVRSVPVNHRERAAGRSKYGNWGRFRVGVVDLLGVMWLKRRARIPDVTETGL